MSSSKMVWVLLTSFGIGALTFWIIVAVVFLVMDFLGHDKAATNFIIAPVYGPIFMLAIIWAVLIGIFYNPWRGVFHPRSAQQVKLSIADNPQIFHRITNRLWFCHDKRAKNIFNKNFFILTKKGQIIEKSFWEEYKYAPSKTHDSVC